MDQNLVHWAQKFTRSLVQVEYSRIACGKKVTLRYVLTGYPGATTSDTRSHRDTGVQHLGRNLQAQKTPLHHPHPPGIRSGCTQPQEGPFPSPIRSPQGSSPPRVVTQSFERLSRSATLALLVAIAPNRSAGLWNWPCIVFFPSSAIKWKFISLRDTDG